MSRTRKDTDNEAFVLHVQRRLIARGHALLDDGHGGNKTRETFDVALPEPPKASVSPTPAAVLGRTKRTLENMDGLNRKARVKLEAFLGAAEQAMAKHGVRVEVLSGTRTWAAQSALYAQGRSKPGPIVTNAKAGSSWHQYGLAIDLGLFRGGVYLDEAEPKLAAKLYAELGKIAAGMDIEWAGTWRSFPEGPHFQWTAGLTLAEARRRLVAVNYDVQQLLAA